MSGDGPRVLRMTTPDAVRDERAGYWRGRSHAERLAAVLALHREGNALFKGGNPPFAFRWTLEHERAG